jgi:RNA polymerase sigma-70 factor (ECF subfamily)
MRAYQDMVFSTAVRLTANPAQAEDISQEVFLRAYESFENLRASQKAGGWLKTVATNLTLNHLTRHRKRWRLFSEIFSEDTREEEFEPAAAVFDTVLTELETDERSALVEPGHLPRQGQDRYPPGKSRHGGPPRSKRCRCPE